MPFIISHPTIPFLCSTNGVRNTRICYLAEVTPEKADYINGLLRMRVVDEIILYTVPFIAGTGRHFFQSVLPETQWILTSQKSYPNGVCRSIYTRMEATR